MYLLNLDLKKILISTTTPFLFSEKMMKCLACPFLQTVQDDESVSFVLVPAPGP